MQQTLDMPPPAFPAEAYSYGQRSSGETHGVVLTKPHVVELILDLAGYTADRDLCAMRLLEPACGHGAFLVPAIERLLASAKRAGRDVAGLANAIAAFDIDEGHVALSRRHVASALAAGGVPARAAASLASSWITRADFLLAPKLPRFEAIVGNPPYIRIEHLARTLQAEYRARYQALYDRADLYVAFIERGLDLLAADGLLSFVCADRWTLNKYGAPLRRKIAGFRVASYIDLHQASPFEADVIAYPAIFAIGRGTSRHVKVAKLATASPEECRALSPAAQPRSRVAGVETSVYRSWFKGEEPWTLASPEHLEALRSLEERFAPIEADGTTKVRIGVATGNDKLYIVDEGADIEPDRLVPLVMREDIEDSTVRDARRFVINTFRPDGSCVDLAEYPRLSRYLKANGDEIRERHVARKNPSSWFRTIDRVYPELVPVPKLLLPDIAGSNEVTLESGRFYPHHNLYFVTSGSWDMEVLGGLLSSKVALFFVWSYAVKMRGGYLRFQAQYLRRIRLPNPSDLAPQLAASIRDGFRRRDFARLDDLARDAYGTPVLPDFPFVDTRAAGEP